MPGAVVPASFKEYEEKNGDPFAHHDDHAEGHSDHSEPHSDAAKKGAH
jgi:hypothetical protein